MDTFLSFFGTNPSPLIWVYELAAKLSSIDVEEMESHENILYDSLHSVVDLFDLPALCVSFDTTLESTSMNQRAVTRRPPALNAQPAGRTRMTPV